MAELPFHISVREIPAKTEAYLSSFATITTNLAWKYNLCWSIMTPATVIYGNGANVSKYSCLHATSKRSEIVAACPLNSQQFTDIGA